METNNTEPRAYHRLDSVEEVDEFYQAIARERLTQKLSPEHTLQQKQPQLVLECKKLLNLCQGLL